MKWFILWLLIPVNGKINGLLPPPFDFQSNNFTEILIFWLNSAAKAGIHKLFMDSCTTTVVYVTVMVMHVMFSVNVVSYDAHRVYEPFKCLCPAGSAGILMM